MKGLAVGLSALSVLVGASQVSAADRGQWVLTDVGAKAMTIFPGYTGLALLGLTSGGRVLLTAQKVGASQVEREVFQWQNGHISDLGPLPPTMLASGWNDGGAIVGAFHDPPYCPVYGPGAPGCKSGPSHAYLWQPGYATPLGTLGGDSSSASAINDRGQIVGASETTHGAVHAFLWQDRRMIDISPPGTVLGNAFAINNRGQALVYASFGKTSASYLWQHGKLTELSAPGVEFDASQLNDRGDVLGASYKQGWKRSNTVFWRRGRTIDLGPSDDPYGLIDDRGDVVISRVSEHAARAILWRNGTFRDIGNLGGPETYAAAINDRGDIVGTSLLAARTQSTFRSGAFFWRDGEMTALPGSPNFFVTPMAIDGTGTHVVLGTQPNTCYSVADDCAGHILFWTYQP